MFCRFKSMLMKIMITFKQQERIIVYSQISTKRFIKESIELC